MQRSVLPYFQRLGDPQLLLQHWPEFVQREPLPRHRGVGSGVGAEEGTNEEDGADEGLTEGKDDGAGVAVHPPSRP